jgi:hypothetical protein
MPSWKAWVERPGCVFKRGGETQVLKARLQNCLKKYRMGSKSLQVTMINKNEHSCAADFILQPQM